MRTGDAKQILHRRRDLESESVVRSLIVSALFGVALGIVVGYGLASAAGLFDRGMP